MEFTLTVRRPFAVPAGGEITYVGLGKWSYRPPDADGVVTGVDDAHNTYARDTGGMRGTRWRVLRVEALAGEEPEARRLTVQPLDAA